MRPRINLNRICSTENYEVTLRAHKHLLTQNHSIFNVHITKKVYGYRMFGDLVIIKTKTELEMAVKAQFNIIEL